MNNCLIYVNLWRSIQSLIINFIREINKSKWKGWERQKSRNRRKKGKTWNQWENTFSVFSSTSNLFSLPSSLYTFIHTHMAAGSTRIRRLIKICRYLRSVYKIRFSFIWIVSTVSSFLFLGMHTLGYLIIGSKIRTSIQVFLFLIVSKQSVSTLKLTKNFLISVRDNILAVCWLISSLCGFRFYQWRI